MPSNNKYFHCLDIQTIRAVSYTACLSYSHSDLAEQWAAIDIDLIVASCKTLTSLVYLRVGRYVILRVDKKVIHFKMTDVVIDIILCI